MTTIDSDRDRVRRLSVSPMESRENDPDAIGDFYRAWDERDVDALVRTFVDEGVFADPLSRVPLSGDALRRHLSATVNSLPELKFTVQRTLRDGLDVAVVWSLTALCKGALDPEITADGVPFHLEGIDLFHLHEERIVSSSDRSSVAICSSVSGCRASSNPSRSARCRSGIRCATGSAKPSRRCLE